MTNANKIGEGMSETIEMFNMKYHKRAQLFARFEMNEFGFHLHLNGRQVETQSVLMSYIQAKLNHKF